jgi:hypothetical protein
VPEYVFQHPMGLRNLGMIVASPDRCGVYDITTLPKEAPKPEPKGVRWWLMQRST